LVTGGFGSTGYVALEQLYDPETGTWAATGSMAWGRFEHTATLLDSGKVLVTGGSTGDSATTGFLATAEVYEPGTGTWVSTGSMTRSRATHTATLLPLDKVLVTGGVTGGTNVTEHHATAEVYDPATGTWASTGSMATKRSYHTATMLLSGKVLVVGGTDGNAPTATAELYIPGP
jgi:hypothetical protein